MKIIRNIIFTYFYLRGVLKFRTQDYLSAQLLFKKALEVKQSQNKELIYQYYGQTLLSLNKSDESFFYLSKSYDIYEKEGWVVVSDEEYRLVKDTLEALKYLEENFKLKANNFTFDKRIDRK